MRSIQKKKKNNNNNMTFKSSNNIIKLLVIFLFFIFMFLMLPKSNISSSLQNNPLSSYIISSQAPLNSTPSDNKNSLICAKTPMPLAQALVHYVTSNITPQQTFDEISVTLALLQNKSPCNFLVYGLGHDSLMWSALNYGGRTVFLEENQDWIDQIKSKLPTLESYHVKYDTLLTQAHVLMKAGMGKDCKRVGDPRTSKCRLALKGLPDNVYDVEWDLIMVDAPTGYHDGAPGRMTALYTAGLMARNRADGETDVLVHDVDRAVEDKFSKAFLCDGYLSKQEGRLRHFVIPSHRSSPGLPFCP